MHYEKYILILKIIIYGVIHFLCLKSLCEHWNAIVKRRGHKFAYFQFKISANINKYIKMLWRVKMEASVVLVLHNLL